MSAMSDYLENQFGSMLLRTLDMTKPTVFALSLGIATILDADTGSVGAWEAADSGSYARQDEPPLDANWAAIAAAGLTDNVSEIAFPTATGSWGTITDACGCSSATYATGEIYVYGVLSASKAVAIDDIFKFPIGNFDVTFA